MEELQERIEKGDLVRVKRLVSQDSSLLQVRFGWRGAPPLTFAILEGQKSIAKWLIENGKCLDLPDKSGWSPLMHACGKGFLDIATLLVQNGASVNLQAPSGNWCGTTALMFACQGGYEATVNLLVQSGADVNLQNEQGQSALMCACTKGANSIVELLVQNGANVSQVEKNGRNALMHACNNGQASAARILLENKAEIDVQDNQGWTALMLASCYGNEETVRLLLEREADVDLRDSRGLNVLEVIKKSGTANAGGRYLLEFVMNNEIAKFLQGELGMPRTVALAFYDNKTVTLRDCARLSDGELERLGVHSAEARALAIERFAKGKRQSLAKRISRSLFRWSK